MDEEVDDIDDIFGEYENIIAEDEGQNNQNGLESSNAPNTDFPETVAPPTKKRILKHPRLKFDPDRLCGSRGIPILVEHFKDVKFKGKGHEVEDLDRLLSTLEHWTHRLFPSMKFEETLHHIEKLGRKKAVQVCVQKIRLDLPILNSDFVGAEEELDDVARVETAEAEEGMSAFDHLFEEHQRDTQSTVQETEPLPMPQTSTMSLTEEQHLRMQRNKELAAERRRSRLEREAAIQQEQHRDLTLTSAVDINSKSEDTHDDLMTEEGPSSHFEQPAKRMRVLSDSDEDCDIDDLVQQSLMND